MPYLNEWRSQILESISQFAELAADARDIDLRYGLLATAILWPICQRVQDFDNEAIDAVRQVMGEKAKYVLRSIQGWGDDRIDVARNLATQAKTDEGLRSALEGLISYFGVIPTFVEALKPVIATQNVASDVHNIDGILKAALINIGGTQTIQTLFLQLPESSKKDYTILSSPDEARERRQQLTLLGRVKTFRIKSTLEKSVHHEVLVELGKEMRPGLVEHPWDVTISWSKQPDRPIPVPTGKRIVEIFDEMGQTLLILGTPGSGKTITLLELARDLIARAEVDLTHPIPVVFDLASWAGTKQSLTDWLVQELYYKYEVSHDTAKRWVEGNMILPLLDGLDEVYLEFREACTSAINQFQHEHSFLGIVVSSRIEDYLSLKTRLKFEGAVMIQPLTDEQVDKYLRSFGGKLESLRQAIEKDENLRELSRVPLMLGVMCLAYEGVPLQTVMSGQLESIEGRRKHLFNTYILRMFDRVERRKSKRYSFADSQVVHWLSELARNTRWGQPVFLIDGIQPYWLPEHALQLFRICLGLFLGALAGFVGNIPPGDAYYAGAMLAFTFRGAPLALATGFVLVLASISFPAILGGLYGFGVGWILREIGDRAGWGSSLSLDHIFLANRISWSWEHIVRKRRYYLLSGLGLGLFLALTQPTPWFLGALGQTGSANIIVDTLIYGSCLGLVTVLIEGFNQSRVEVRPISLKQAARNAVFVGLVGCVMLAVVFHMLLGPGKLILVAVISGVFLGLWFGGFAVIQHYFLRLVLTYANCLPWGINHFLDYCADRVFLRQVGRGYAFIHRLLLEHFAEIDQPEE